MKKVLISTICSLLFSLPLYSLKVSITHSVLYSENKPYLELYARFLSDHIKYVEDSQNGSKQVMLEYTILLKNDDQIIEANKYLIENPDGNSNNDFWDRRRFFLETGQYELEILIENVSDRGDEPFEYNSVILIHSCHSFLELAEPILVTDLESTGEKNFAFDWHNISFEPLSYNLISDQNESLLFLQEIYHTDIAFNDSFYIGYYIINENDQKILSAYKRFEIAQSAALVLEMKIDDLKSGQYKLEVEVGDRDRNVLCSKSKVFGIYKPLNDLTIEANFDKAYEDSFVQFMKEDELNYALKALFAQTGRKKTGILNQIIAENNLRTKRYYLFDYWSRISPNNPKTVFDKYMEVVKAIDIKYASQLGFGFETDRGYIFLKYGRPNDLIYVEDEPSAPPYEIWVYENLEATKQSNVKFLFYNPSLGYNDFELLHSTCRGERRNPRWELELYRDALLETSPNNINNVSMQRNWNRRAKEYFEDF